MLYFFSGLGGAGTLPLAFILKGLGHDIAWSDRGRDRGQNPAKFKALETIWPQAYPQDGSGLHALGNKIAAIIPSGSVEADVPELVAARALNIPLKKRPEMLAELFNAAPTGVAIGGTSGKTTTTGMTGYLLEQLGADPTVMNGGVFRNYKDRNPWCCALVGQSGVFVSEVDESDGTIALYRPKIAVLTNISLDHKSMDELRALFRTYIESAQTAVLNIDDTEVRSLGARPGDITYGLENADARLSAHDITLLPGGSRCLVRDNSNGQQATLSLQVLGKHNISNALAALCVAVSLGHDLQKACMALGSFIGIERRLEVIGTQNGITVIDDFAHNPDKVAASLSALKAFPGRLLIMFQPTGFGPLRFMRHELAASFARHLGPQDKLFMPEPFYAGGTADRTPISVDVVADMKAQGVDATVWDDRSAATASLLAAARPGDRIVVMGARDDTLGDYARGLLAQLAKAA